MRDEVPDLCTATVEGDFVVFLIGVPIAKPWKVRLRGPVVAAMPRMLADLGRRGAAEGTDAARERID